MNAASRRIDRHTGSQAVVHRRGGALHLDRVLPRDLVVELGELPGECWASCAACGVVRAVDVEGGCPFTAGHRYLALVARAIEVGDRFTWTNGGLRLGRATV